MFKKLILLALVFIYFGLQESEAQSNCKLSLSGKIICADDSQTLPGAMVFLSASQSAVATDSTGKFVIDNLCSGSVVLKISYVGYTTLDTTLNLSENKKTDFYLHAS